MHAIPERLRDVTCTGAMQINIIFTLPLPSEGPQCSHNCTTGAGTH